MGIFKTIIEILCVAFVTMLLYAWGYVKQQRKPEELIKLLHIKAEKKIIKALKKNSFMTRSEIEKEIQGMKASLFYSKHKVVVKEPKIISKEIIEDLVNKNIIIVDESKKIKRYKLVNV